MQTQTDPYTGCTRIMSTTFFFIIIFYSLLVVGNYNKHKKNVSTDMSYTCSYW